MHAAFMHCASPDGWAGRIPQEPEAEFQPKVLLENVSKFGTFKHGGPLLIHRSMLTL